MHSFTNACKGETSKKMGRLTFTEAPVWNLYGIWSVYNMYATIGARTASGPEEAWPGAFSAACIFN